MWITSKAFREKYSITPQQLYRLKKSGKIKTKPYIAGKFLIEDTDDNPKQIVIYARVSTPKQKKDLENQVMFLRQFCVSKGYAVSDVFTDIASGMNEKRKGLSELLTSVIKSNVSKIVISHKDRLTRFGFGYLEDICSRFNTEIEVVNLEDDKSFKDELTEDLIAIIHHFSMKFYGKRKNICKDIQEKANSLKMVEDK